jgi:hypothetical protein
MKEIKVRELADGLQKNKLSKISFDHLPQENFS